MKGQSLDITKELLEQLKKLVPQAFSEDKLDVTQLRTLLGEDLFIQNERYGLSWAGKNEAYQVMQQPTIATLEPQLEESIDWDEAQHLFIEGENLEVLKLLQKSYFGQVKMIYIDPPYNTGNDSFIYPDKFSETKEEYLARIEEKSDDGYLMKEGYFRKNSKENGQYHSNWLSMMLPRLYLARNLLRDDGVIFVSIDDNEQANLKLLMDEVFGEGNIISTIIWERAYSPVNLKKHFSINHDYILCYAKNKEILNDLSLKRTDEANNRYKNPDQDLRGVWKSSDFSVGPANEKNIYEIIIPSGRKVLPPKGRSWVVSKEKYRELLVDNKVWFGEDGNSSPSYKRFLSEVKEGVTPLTIWKYSEVGHTQEATKELKNIFGGEALFSYPKPVKLIKRMVELATNNNEIVLDFFSGSGTTAQAVMELNEENNGNRRYICVQLPEKTEETSEAYKAGYKTISEITQARIQKVIEKIKQQREEQGTLLDEAKPKLGYRKFTLAGSNFKQWRGDIPQTEQDIETLLDKIEQVEYSNAKPQAMLWELLLKNGYSLTEQVKMIQAGNTPIYLTANQHLAIVLEAYSEQVQAKLLTIKPKQVITLDSLFKGQDMVKANYQLKLKDNDIEFKTI